MESKLISVRVKSFLYSLLSYGTLGVLAFLTSEEFAKLVTEHFGNTAATSLVLLVVPELVKHFRNLEHIKALGSNSSEVTLI